MHKGFSQSAQRGYFKFILSLPQYTLNRLLFKKPINVIPFSFAISTARLDGAPTDAARVMCEWLFETRPALVRIEAKVHYYNPASVRVLEKVGFEQEGFARKHTIKNGALIDVILMAVMIVIFQLIIKLEI